MLQRRQGGFGTRKVSEFQRDGRVEPCAFELGVQWWGAPLPNGPRKKAGRLNGNHHGSSQIGLKHVEQLNNVEHKTWFKPAAKVGR